MSSFKKVRKKIKYQLLYWFVRSLIAMSNFLPRGMWLSFCGSLGSLAGVFMGETRRLMEKNISIAFPELNHAETSALAKKTFKMLGKNAGEVLRGSQIDTLDQLNKVLVTHGYENFERAHAKGKGVIFLTAHVGAFDLQITNMAIRNLKPRVIGTPLKDERLNDLLWNARNKHGAVAVARGQETFGLIKALRSGDSVALLIDQDTRVKSVFVDFFGKPASTPVGATTLALKTGAAVVPTYIYLGEDGMQHMHILPEVPMEKSGNEEEDIIRNTQVLTHVIEGWIRQHPAQWVWMHERWKTQPALTS